MQQLVRRAAVSMFVGCLAIPTVGVLSASAPAGAATSQTAASSDPIGDLVANIEANVNYYVCVIELPLLNMIERLPGFCVMPPPLGS